MFVLRLVYHSSLNKTWFVEMIEGVKLFFTLNEKKIYTESSKHKSGKTKGFDIFKREGALWER